MQCKKRALTADIWQSMLRERKAVSEILTPNFIEILRCKLFSYNSRRRE